MSDDPQIPALPAPGAIAPDNATPFLTPEVLDALNAPHAGTVTEGALSPEVLQALNTPPADTAKPQATPEQAASLKAYGKHDLAADIMMSVMDAFPKGAAKFFGSAGDLQKAVSDLSDRIWQKLGVYDPVGDNGATKDALYRSYIDAGMTPDQAASKVAEELPKYAAGGPLRGTRVSDIIENALPTSRQVRAFMEATQGKPFYEPQSGAAKYIAAPVEGAVGMPFAPVAGAISGVGGEAGAQVFGEKYGRLLGALAGGGTAVIANLIKSSPEALIRSVLSNASEAELAQAQNLMDQAAAKGTPLTGAEALGQVIGPNRLNEMQRVLESSTRGSPAIQPIMAARPGANDTAMRGTLDQIGPPVTQPTEIAPRVQAAAEGTVNDTRDTINDATQGFYQKSAAQTVPQADFAALSGNAVFKDVLSQVRKDPVYGNLAGMPDNSIAVLDAVQKKMGRIADTMQTSGDRAGAAAYLQAKDMVTGAAKTASPDYAMAVGGQATMREQFLDPLERSPVGQLAEAKGFQQQAKIIFDPNPLPGSEVGVARAVREVAARDPEAAQQFVRARLEQAFNEVTQQLASGPNQFGGAGFAATMAGNPQQARNLKAAVSALPNGEDASEALQNIMRIFQAQGTRTRAGSQTAFNTEMQAELSKGGAVGEIFRQAGQPESFIKNMATKLYYNRNVSRLADILTDPNSVDRMRQIAKINPGSDKARALYIMLTATAENSPTDQPQ